MGINFRRNLILHLAKVLNFVNEVSRKILKESNFLKGIVGV